MIRAGEVDIKEKPNEMAVIEVADAVIHPGTMMIFIKWVVIMLNFCREGDSKYPCARYTCGTSSKLQESARRVNEFLPFTLFTVVSPGGLGFLTESTISRLSGELLDFITIFRRVRFLESPQFHVSRRPKYITHPIIRYAAWVRGYS